MQPDRGAAAADADAGRRSPATLVRAALRSNAVWWATAALFVVSWVVEPRSVSSVSIDVMLPFAAVLAIAAIGQTLVMQQRGVDLSVAGTLTISAIVVSKLDAPLGTAIVVVLAIAAVIGLVNGCAVVFLHVTPLIATLATNAIVAGAVIAYSNASQSTAPHALVDFVGTRPLGVSAAVWLALAIMVIVAVTIAWSTVGRRFVAVGAGLRASRAAGIRDRRHVVGAYVAAAVLYGIAGIVLAGYVQNPSIKAGDEYLLPSIAAVVVGGTGFAGGRGRIVGTAVGALLLSQLSQLVLSLGAPTSTQFVVQAAVIAIAAAAQAEGGGGLRAAAAWVAGRRSMLQRGG